MAPTLGEDQNRNNSSRILRSARRGVLGVSCGEVFWQPFRFVDAAQRPPYGPRREFPCRREQPMGGPGADGKVEHLPGEPRQEGDPTRGEQPVTEPRRTGDGRGVEDEL